MLLVTGLALSFLYPLFLAVWPGWVRGRRAYWTAAVPALLFLGCLQAWEPVMQGGMVILDLPWAPSLGVSLTFTLDGLSFLFSLLITGIGTLIFLYASAYMKGYADSARLFGWLGIFMGAMLGLVWSDNLITLFIFWELTSISSFFLIGYYQEDQASRQSARTALAVTGLGGLALLAAGLLIGQETGGYGLAGLHDLQGLLTSSPLYPLIAVLVMLAAFTKSAQFPFHFWLPGAMKAPTPVSAYLHSATMVKAGVYLLLRFSPSLGGTEWWTWGLTAAGGITMVYAAWQTLFRTDLKALLAYSTVSALGIMVFMTGWGTGAAIKAAIGFVLVHALYKAPLFLVAGVLDKVTGTREVTQLAGWGRALPFTAAAGLLAALSNAGLPPFLGFVGKDLVYEALLAQGNPVALWGMALAFVTNVLLLWAGLQAGLRPFAGKPSPISGRQLSPGAWLWGPPLLLALLGLLAGCWPAWAGSWLLEPALRVAGHPGREAELALWHGFGPVLALSAATLLSGALLAVFIKPSVTRAQRWMQWERFAPESIVHLGYSMFSAAGSRITRLLQNGYLRHYVFAVTLFLLVVAGIQLVPLVAGRSLPYRFTAVTVYEVMILVMMAASIGFTVFTRSRLIAVASLGVTGYAICLLFVFYSAPDLAMTQFTIDTLTVILFVLVVFRLPRYMTFSTPAIRWRDGIQALAFGAVIFLLILAVLAEPVTREVGDYYARNAYLLAKGKNVVNVILVDFRGLDTLVEISVLAVAAIGVFGLLKLRLKPSEWPDK